MLFADPPLLAAGSEPLVRRVLAGLERVGRRAESLTPDALAELRLRRGQTLVLAAPPDAQQLLPGLIEGLSARVRRGRGGPARLILIYPSDPPAPWLTELKAPDPQDRLRLETFALEDQAARALLVRWPLHVGMDPAFGQGPHLLIAGFAPPAQALLVHALRLIHYGEERARVTVACGSPAETAAAFRAAYPQADEVAEIRWTDPDDPDLPLAPTLVLTALDPPDAGAALARRLAERIAQEHRSSPPILLETGDLCLDGDLEDWDGQIFPFSYRDLACAPGVLLDGQVDRLAQTIHEHYTDSIAAQGRDPEREPAGRPWAQLGTSYREANRHQADHLWAKLAVTDCRAVPAERVDVFAFAPLEAERLAVIEHLRWAADRYLDGWSYAPVRDNARKHHPQLVPYDALSEPMKDLDRFAVRGVPNLLARCGLGLVRMLILGIGEDPPVPPSGAMETPALERLARLTLERLVARYPDRSLVVASTLGDPAARLFARLALEQARAGLFLLCPRPLQETLERQPDRTARLELLALVARAERRIPLTEPGELERWLAERAEIRLWLTDEGTSARTPKRVVLDPPAGRVHWGFEY